MGGQGSDMFEYFKLLILQGLIAARKHSDKILSLVDIMRAGKKKLQMALLCCNSFLKIFQTETNVVSMCI